MYRRGWTSTNKNISLRDCRLCIVTVLGNHPSRCCISTSSGRHELPCLYSKCPHPRTSIKHPNLKRELDIISFCRREDCPGLRSLGRSGLSRLDVNDLPDGTGVRPRNVRPPSTYIRFAGSVQYSKSTQVYSPVRALLTRKDRKRN